MSDNDTKRDNGWQQVFLLFFFFIFFFLDNFKLSYTRYDNNNQQPSPRPQHNTSITTTASNPRNWTGDFQFFFSFLFSWSNLFFLKKKSFYSHTATTTTTRMMRSHDNYQHQHLYERPLRRQFFFFLKKKKEFKVSSEEFLSSNIKTKPKQKWVVVKKIKNKKERKKTPSRLRVYSPWILWGPRTFSSSFSTSVHSVRWLRWIHGK